MQIFFGALSIRGLDSFLLPGNRWLLMAGFPDVRHAARAATNFIAIRHLDTGAYVVVTGEERTIGEQPAIEMTDINAAGRLAPRFIASDEYKAELADAEQDVKLLFKPTSRKKAASKRKSNKDTRARKQQSR
jgi:hypothetical protein